MSTTILRVKRRLEDNPQDALVITCKKIKTDVEDVTPSLFVFRGTVESQETAHVKSIVPRCNVKQQTEVNVKDIVEKLRKEHKEVSINARYEVVNYRRGLKDDTAKDNLFDLVDLQKSEDTDDGVKYAYDLYIAAKQDLDVSNIDNFMSIETDLTLSAYRDGRETPSGDEVDDDDDSNDENNWRNDYPDSEASSIDVEDMVMAMERADIGDLSSDEGEDKIYENESNIFEENAKLYGAAYAKYKARVLSENPDLADQKSLVYCAKMKDIDEESIEGYKDDSDDGFYYGQDEDNSQLKEQYRDSLDEDNPD